MNNFEDFYAQKEYRKKNKGKSFGFKIGVCEICLDKSKVDGTKLYNQNLVRHEYYGGRDRLNIKNLGLHLWICPKHNQLLETYGCDKWLEKEHSFKCKWKHCKRFPCEKIGA